MPQPAVILDACVLLNLLASDEAEDILRASGSQYLICEVVAQEVIYVRTDARDEESFEAIQVGTLVDAGIVTICALEDQLEEALYVSYAGQLGDGEAMSIAIAEVRGYKLATDDRKARRVFLEAVADANRLIFTSELIRHWAKQRMIANDRLKSALLSIRQKASFFPPKSDPNSKWWISILNS